MKSNELVEIVLPNEEMFLILKETLTRIGIPNKDGTKLFQTCHILCKKKRYFVTHFKELFILDGRPSNFNEIDLSRRNSIINYLINRKFFTLANGATILEPHLSHTIKDDDFTIITYNQRNKWERIPKYVIGNPANKKVNKKVPKKIEAKKL